MQEATEGLLLVHSVVLVLYLEPCASEASRSQSNGLGCSSQLHQKALRHLPEQIDS